MLFAASGLLDGYFATTHWAFLECFPALFPKVKIADGHPRFVLDRNRLTGAGISAGLDEALMLITLLGGTELAREVQQNTQYYPDPPVRSTISAGAALPSHRRKDGVEAIGRAIQVASQPAVRATN